jgi:hypothetical protein
VRLGDFVDQSVRLCYFQRQLEPLLAPFTTGAFLQYILSHLASQDQLLPGESLIGKYLLEQYLHTGKELESDLLNTCFLFRNKQGMAIISTGYFPMKDCEREGLVTLMPKLCVVKILRSPPPTNYPSATCPE